MVVFLKLAPVKLPVLSVGLNVVLTRVYVVIDFSESVMLSKTWNVHSLGHVSIESFISNDDLNDHRTVSMN